MSPECDFKLLDDLISKNIHVFSQRIELKAINKMSRFMRKLDFCICENKDADQLRGDSEADQRLCFRYMDSTIPILTKSEISNL